MESFYQYQQAGIYFMCAHARRTGRMFADHSWLLMQHALDEPWPFGYIARGSGHVPYAFSARW